MKQHYSNFAKRLNAHNLMMAACCVAMVAAFGITLAVLPATSSFTSVAWSAVPMVICIGGHFAMHKFWGRSCHNQNTDGVSTPERTSK